MEQLTVIETAVFFLIFIWSGFVRTALGFGGAALSLPLFLFIIDDPVEIIPIIGIHLLLSAAVSLRRSYQHINWQYLAKTMTWMFPFKIAGVIGLLSLPATIVNVGVYLITAIYALSYITQIRWKFSYRPIDWGLLATGSYISGTSLIGAPLIIAVYSKHLAQNQLRATLFALWFILVTIKLIAFIVNDTSLQLAWTVYTLPFALIGHILGDKVHQRIVTMDKSIFMQRIGYGLLAICLLGLFRIIFFSH